MGDDPRGCLFGALKGAGFVFGVTLIIIGVWLGFRIFNTVERVLLEPEEITEAAAGWEKIVRGDSAGEAQRIEVVLPGNMVRQKDVIAEADSPATTQTLAAEATDYPDQPMTMRVQPSQVALLIDWNVPRIIALAFMLIIVYVMSRIAFGFAHLGISMTKAAYDVPAAWLKPPPKKRNGTGTTLRHTDHKSHSTTHSREDQDNNEESNILY